MLQDALLATLSREVERISKNSENWQERMAALGAIQKAFETLADVSAAGPDAWKILKPLRSVVLDLRSQIVKEVCNVFVAIARATRDAMVPLLRDVLPVLVDVRGSGNKVCGNYCNECVEALIALVVVKGATLRYFSDTLLESKNKLIRLSCITALTLTLAHWSAVLDKSDVQQLERGLKNALYDASSSCRSQSHELFLLFQRKFPKRAALLLTMVDYKVQRRLEVLLADTVKSRTGGSIAGSVDDNVPPTPAAAPATASSVEQPLTGYSFSVGDRVCIPDKELFGFVRYLGEIEGTKGLWVGVELDEPYGKNDGSAKGKTYFLCKPKHGVFARPHQIFLTISGARLQEQQERLSASVARDPDSADTPNGVDTVSAQDSPSDEQHVMRALSDELQDASLDAFTETPTPPAAPLGGDTHVDEPSALSIVLERASIAHRRYIDRLLQYARSELEEHQRFENYAATASSADAVQYLQQLQNCAQDKIVLSDMFIQEMIQAQQAARES